MDLFYFVFNFVARLACVMDDRVPWSHLMGARAWGECGGCS
jgi:hypothetical protein